VREIFRALQLKPCPHCRRNVRLSPKMARKRRQSHFSATCMQCGQGLTLLCTL